MLNKTCILCYDEINNNNYYCLNCTPKWYKLNENKNLNIICEQFDNLLISKNCI
jgi:hypothetical protein